jgi:hypothetical protein
MNKRSMLLRTATICIFSLIVAGCNFPTAASQSEPTVEAVHTSAAETISAQLTGLAPTTQTASETPAAGITSVVVDTPTLSIGSTESATHTPSPTAENTLTLTVTPSPTLAVSDPKADLGNPTWQDTFENASNWAPYEDEHVRFTIEEGRLDMLSKQAESRDSWMLSWPNPDDFYIEMNAAPEGCSGLDRYGLIFHSEGDNGYLFGISCDGRYSLREWDGERFTALIEWQASPVIQIQPGATNRIGVLAEGNKFTLYVNGVQLDETRDGSFQEGSFGVFIGSPETEDFRVVVDQFTYWELP